MALKFLNKKGWHTGTLRNVEKVWKAEQEYEAEQKKLEELRRQIKEEKDRSDLPRPHHQTSPFLKDRLEFLYDPKFAVRQQNNNNNDAKNSSFELFSKPATAAPPQPSQPQSTVPGALFEEKQPSHSDAWRKLHSDPLFLIKKKEQEARNRVVNNPVLMAKIGKEIPVGKDNQRRETSNRKRGNRRVKISEEERRERLLEMQRDAKLWEGQREKRLKRADENDAKEAVRNRNSACSRGKNFLDGVHKSVYGIEDGGSSSIQERIQRKRYYLQDQLDK